MGKVTHVNQTIYREQSTKQPRVGKVVRKKYLFELARGLYRNTEGGRTNNVTSGM